MILRLDMEFHTDGDFAFRDIGRQLDPGRQLYKGASIDYRVKTDDEEICFNLACIGEANACRWAARDLVESLICSISTFKAYLVGDLYRLLDEVLENLWKDGKVQHEDSLSGNYNGTSVKLLIVWEESDKK